VSDRALPSDQPVEPPPSEFAASSRLLGAAVTGPAGLVGISGVVLLLLVSYHREAALKLGLVSAQWHLLGWVVVNVVCLLLVPIALIKLLTKERLADYGLTLGEWRVWLRHAAVYLAVALPVIAIASRSAAFRDYYPMFEPARHRPLLLIPWEFAYGAYFFAWEFFFRGYLLQGLRQRFGPAAIVIQMVPFVMMHFGKLEAEAIGSILAGLLLGVTAYRTRSTVGCWLIHWICAATMDVLALL
jgi:membrane protease YdiL (CAAX protease family)